MPPRSVPYDMKVKLWGMFWQSQTKDAISMLEDAKVKFEFIDVEDVDSIKMEQILALSGDKKLPQLFVNGNLYAGRAQIREYIKS